MRLLNELNHWILLCLILWLSISASAQSNFGLGTSNYLVTASSQLNPAEVGRMKHKWMVSPFAIQASVHNNYLSMRLPYSPYRLINKSVPETYTNRDGTPYKDWNWVASNTRESHLNFYSSTKIQGPSVFVRSKKWVFGINQALHNYIFIEGLPSSLVEDQLEQLKDEGTTDAFEPTSLITELENPSNVKLFQNTYNAIGLTVAREFELRHDRNLSLGATYKLINSLGGLSFKMKSEGINRDVNSGNYQFSNPEIELNEWYARNNKFKTHGLGGLDIGAVYTYRNKETLRRLAYLNRHDNYKLKLGASILDIGNLVYSRTISTALKVDYSIDLSILDKLQTTDPQELFAEIEAAKQPNKESSIQTTYGERTKVGLPTRMVLFADLQLFKRFYMNAMAIKNLRGPSIYNQKSQDLIQVTPRFETNFFELGLPITLRDVNPKITQGLSLRVFNFYISSQNILPFFKPKDISELSINVGVQFSNLPGSFFKSKYRYRRFSKKGCSQF